MANAIDYSFARPAPAAIKASGAEGVIRYVSKGAKGLTAAEARGLLAVGLWIGLVYEGAAGDAKLGTARGAADARFANDDLDGLGCPSSAAVFYACDTHATIEEVRPYFQGVKSVGRRRRGWYGGLFVGLQLQAEGLIDYVWAANATSWSGFANFGDLQNAARAHHVAMLQHLDHPLPGIPPAAYDFDEVITRFPAWGYTPQEAPVRRPDLHIKVTSPIVGYLDIEGVGAWLALEDGGVLTLAGQFHGTPHGQPYFAGLTAAAIKVNPNVVERKAHPYVIIGSNGHTYGLAGF